MAVRGTPDLDPDCSRCFGLCCVALPFARSSDFAHTKPAGRPCHNLLADDRCGIHDHLRERGWRGCTVYDCFGAGQQVSQVTFGGVSWRDDPTSAATMFAVLPVMHRLHEMLAHLDHARQLGCQVPELDKAYDKVTDLTQCTADELVSLDLSDVRNQVAPLLRECSLQVRAAVRPDGRPERPGADLVGVRLRGADLRAADLRGALLVAADLREADLRSADLLGADLRDADLRGSDLREALFLTRPQVAAARGDGRTRLPDGFARPAHWPTGRTRPAPPR